MSGYRWGALAALIVAAGEAPAHAADTVVQQQIAGTRLDVSADGEVSATPDLATVTAGVVTQAPSAAAAMADNARRVAAALAALRRAGVADRDIRTANLSLQPQYRYADNQPPAITGYQASNALTVRFHDVARAGPVLDALVGQGVNQVSGPDLSVEDPSALLDQARAQAVARARARADLYARAMGMRVVRVVSVAEAGGGEPPMPRPMMMMAREKASTEIVPGEQKIGVTVNATFELQ